MLQVAGSVATPPAIGLEREAGFKSGTVEVLEGNHDEDNDGSG